MKIDEIKKKMKEYKDFFDGDLISSGEIDNATTREQLEVLIQRHHNFLEDQCNDAQRHLLNFKKSLGL